KMRPALDRALRCAQLAQQPVVARRPRPVVPTELTRRELDVARLVAVGQTNREIAGALGITEGTGEVHVKHLLSKLGFRSRAQVAAWFARRTDAAVPPDLEPLNVNADAG